MRSTQTDLASNSLASLSADAAAFAAAIKALSLVFAVYAYALRVPLRTRTPAPGFALIACIVNCSVNHFHRVEFGVLHVKFRKIPARPECSLKNGL